MNIGDLVKWHWHLGNATWDKTEFQGIIVGSKIAKTDREKIRIFYVLDNLGEISDVREDAPGLERVV